jgi:hypothetical protein
LLRREAKQLVPRATWFEFPTHRSCDRTGSATLRIFILALEYGTIGVIHHGSIEGNCGRDYDTDQVDGGPPGWSRGGIGAGERRKYASDIGGSGGYWEGDRKAGADGAVAAGDRDSDGDGE